MNFTDQPFPAKASLFSGHSVVRQYLEDSADEIRPLIKLSSQILSVTKTSKNEQNNGGWEVKMLDLNTRSATTAHFDAIVVASGHYNDPFVPSIPGLEAFNLEYPTAISHSKFYKSPSIFKGKVSLSLSATVKYYCTSANHRCIEGDCSWKLGIRA